MRGGGWWGKGVVGEFGLCMSATMAPHNTQDRSGRQALTQHRHHAPTLSPLRSAHGNTMRRGGRGWAGGAGRESEMMRAEEFGRGGGGAGGTVRPVHLHPGLW